MRRVLLLLAVVLLGFAPVPFSDPEKADLKKMQGSWILASAHKDGVREEVKQEAVWTIKDDCLTTTLDGVPGSTLFIKLDGTTAPRSIDLRDDRGNDKAALGRYRVEDDTLTVSLGEKRPPDLSGKGPCNGVWVFKRKKP
jgi:uncharacterized protein (TIGR03067 family)